MSVLLRPSKASLTAAINKANAAGIPVDVAHENGIPTLGQSAIQGLKFTRGMAVWTVVSCVLLFGGCYLLATAMICYMVRPGHLTWTTIVTFGMAALLLSAIGNDYGRWWALAFVTVVAEIVMLDTSSTVKRRLGRAHDPSPDEDFAMALRAGTSPDVRVVVHAGQAGDIPPVELEQTYYRQHNTGFAEAG
jgi:hypothetical protein